MERILCASCGRPFLTRSRGQLRCFACRLRRRCRDCGDPLGDDEGSRCQPCRRDFYLAELAEEGFEVNPAPAPAPLPGGMLLRNEATMPAAGPRAARD